MRIPPETPPGLKNKTRPVIPDDLVEYRRRNTANTNRTRSRSRDTQYRLAAGGQLGAETSIDKILIAGSEQLLMETARDLLPGTIEFDDDPRAALWREDYLYSKAATIYGGTSEIQRNIVARRLLDLGAES